TVKNNENFPVRVYKIGVHYDWMADGTFYELDLGNSYVQIESNMAGRPGQILLSCDRNASVGYHQYYFRLNITRYNTQTSAWDPDSVTGPTEHIYVDSQMRQQALTLLQMANDTLAAAKSSDYYGKGARADLINATDALNRGWSAYNANDYQAAMDDSYQISLYVNDAKTMESNYLASLNATQGRISLVNNKLAVLAGSGSPEVKSLVNESQSHLKQADDYVAAEAWTLAADQIALADSIVDRALNAQFMYRQNVSEIDTSRIDALNAIGLAGDTIALADGLASSTANSLLRDAHSRLEAARADFNSSLYRNATKMANVAEAIALQAMKTEADYHMQQAREKISLTGTLKSPPAIEELNSSQNAYNDSVSDYAKENYRSAIDNSIRAYTLANNTSATERLWKQQHPLNSVIPGFGAMACIVALLAIAYLYRRRG
ncbi:MAG: PGF-CTERM sorting domain-containing protein, partial [Methanocella sp.]